MILGSWPNIQACHTLPGTAMLHWMKASAGHAVCLIACVCTVALSIFNGRTSSEEVLPLKITTPQNMCISWAPAAVPKSWTTGTLKPSPSTLKATPQTPNPKPQTLNPKPLSAGGLLLGASGQPRLASYQFSNGSISSEEVQSLKNQTP